MNKDTDVIYKLNERARGYVRSGMTIDDAIRQAVVDWIRYVSGVGYRTLSEAEIEQNDKTVFFAELREAGK